MDLVAGVKKIVVVMEHTDKTGGPKFVHRCSLPLTGAGVVDMLITDLAVFTIDRAKAKAGEKGAVGLIELAPGVTAPEVRAKTEANYQLELAWA
jgi:3-oxoacid CoA-transferase subunit B/3-oxoadipate CoA-transferase beta subunit